MCDQYFGIIFFCKINGISGIVTRFWPRGQDGPRHHDVDANVQPLLSMLYPLYYN